MRKKWLFMFTLLVSVVFAFSSADCEENQAYKPGVFTKDDLSLVDSTNHTIIKYGMERAQAEKSLGPSQGKDELPEADIYKNIAIFYRNNQTAVALMVNFSTGQTVPYTTWRGIGYGSNLNDVEAKYGKFFNLHELIYYIHPALFRFF